MGLTKAEKFIKEVAELTFPEMMDLPVILLDNLRRKAQRLREKKRGKR